MYIQFKFFGDSLLKNLENNFSLKDLAEKLVTLLCLLSSQRDQTIKEYYKSRFLSIFYYIYRMLSKQETMYCEDNQPLSRAYQ